DGAARRGAVDRGATRTGRRGGRCGGGACPRALAARGRRGMSVGGSVKAFVAELRRRKVFRVVIVYWVVAWTLVEVADNAVPALRLPEWTNSFVMLMALLGFPLAVILAWAYEVTPGGVRRT